MSQNTTSGCGFWGILGLVSLVILGLTHISISAILSPPPIISETPAPSSFSVVQTLVPQDSNPYFTIENNQISYTYSHTLGQPCYYVLSGRVLDINKRPFTKFVVNIKTVSFEGVAPESGYALPGNGAFEEDGVSGWIALLPILTDYEIWLTTKVNGTELSPHFVVHMKDCNQNRAIVNFIETEALP